MMFIGKKDCKFIVEDKRLCSIKNPVFVLNFFYPFAFPDSHPVVLCHKIIKLFLTPVTGKWSSCHLFPT